jgi:diketogulonate reductase-like aldo/keto reductase
MAALDVAAGAPVGSAAVGAAAPQVAGAGQAVGRSEASAESASDLITRAIPSSGEEIPIIGLGTSGPFEVGESAGDRAPLRAVLDAFFAAGGRLVDTSPMYSTAERVLGDLLTPAMHEHAFIATKVWTRGERAGIEQMIRSAQLMKTGKLDLIQVHNLLDLETHLKTLRAWKEAGRVRYIGITHYTVSSHSDLARVISREKLDFVQLNYSPVTRDAEKRLLPLAADQGVAVLVNRPFEDGALFAKLHGKPLPGWAPEVGCTSWSQMCLKYIASHPAVTCIIPATGKVSHLQDNLAGGRGPLPDVRQQQEIVRLLS